VTTPNLELFEKSIEVNFTDKALLRQAFVHRSYLNENPDFPGGHNERLEFLGDAVLELIVTEYLYKTYPNPEGELTNWRSALVKGETLSEVADDLQMEPYLHLSRGEAKGNGRSRQLILANAFEALIGALYLDQGYDITKSFIHRILIGRLEGIIATGAHIDAKSKFQEVAQERHGITPNYEVLSESGPDHDKEFTVGVYLGKKKIGVGEGASKQAAQQEAAKAALKVLEVEDASPSSSS
jgi:ribonuclease-3